MNPPSGRWLFFSGSRLPPPASRTSAAWIPESLNPLTLRRRTAAFTLVELMTATAITTIMLLAMTGIFDQSMKAWRLSSRRADAERDVRAALTLLRRDLAGAVVTTNYPMWVGETNLARVGIASANQPNLAPPTGTMGVVWTNVSSPLFFCTLRRSDASGNGDLAGVGYYVAWDAAANDGRGAYNLYRYYAPPSGVFSNVVAGTGAFPVNNQDELVAANVMNFYADTVGISNNLPVNLGSVRPTNLTTRPAYIQLELTAYGTEAVRAFSSQADWSNTNNITKFGRTYLWRIDL